MTLALDFDGTYSIAPDFWNTVIALAHESGHDVVIVTARRRTNRNRKLIRVPRCPVYFTEGSSKAWYMTERAKRKIDIWIDDDPRSIGSEKLNNPAPASFFRR